jgi:hypothetical protein
MVGRQGSMNIMPAKEPACFLFDHTPTGVFIFALTAYQSKINEEEEDEEITVVRIAVFNDFGCRLRISWTVGRT